MTPDAILEVLRYANGTETPVRLVLRDNSEVTGIPTSVDTHITAHEVFLRPMGLDDMEIGISFAAVISAEMV